MTRFVMTAALRVFIWTTARVWKMEHFGWGGGAWTGKPGA